ncbi:MAG: glycoside hydrolase family 32 protein [Candidatus Marinimicrobia bacterium]|nr:glycoside hydrolase family 32 protein [Candidatus Neomarinimicrobiota bacterium]
MDISQIEMFVMREKTKRDPHRPVYHFSPNNWMNDPIPFFWNGEYHIFFQHNPEGAFWDKMSWGHVVSRDLVHWEQLPIALAPTPNSPDKDGCWTGCVIEENGRFHIFYTGVYPQVICMASSSDLVSWEKYKDNPLNINKPDGYGECFRDPFVWKEKDAWYMIIGGEKRKKTGGVVFLYKSSNLIDWTYLDTLFEGDTSTVFEFECPDFFIFGDKYVLLTSDEKTWWHIGNYSNHKFYRERWGMIDGGLLYAGKTLKDDKGRRILWGWIREDRTEESQIQAGWSGVLSLPRELKLLSDGKIGLKVVSEVKTLRGKHWHFNDIKIKSRDRPEYYYIEKFESDSFEIVAQFAPTNAQEYGIVVRCSPDLKYGITISYNNNLNEFCGVPMILEQGESLSMQVFVDHSVIEAFANEKSCSTLRTYPGRDDYLGIALYSKEGELKIESVDIWEIT